MPVAIKMPDLGTTVDEIKLVAWLVNEGAAVRRGDPIAQIETDKAAGELECVAEGVLLKRVVPDGTTVRTGEILAYVGKPGEQVPDSVAKTEPSEGRAAGPAPGKPPTERQRVSPILRNLAEKMGVDLVRVQGTGQGGMITREDVLHASKSGPAAAASASPAGEQLSRSQSAVAKAVVRSMREIPHLRVEAAVDMTAAERVRAAGAGDKISYDALFLKAMAGAIRAVPRVAARLDGDRITRPTGIHIAIAVGRENDLFLPVIRDVDRKSLSALQSEIADLAARAGRGTLKPEEMTGGCMALSNLGMYPVESFDAIIFPEHSAIVSVGTVQKKPVATGDRLMIRPVAMVKLAVDHRLINGRTAAEFLTRVKEAMEAGSF